MNVKTKSSALFLSTIFTALSVFSPSDAIAQAEPPRARLRNPVPASSPFAWKVKKTTWSAQDEAEFGQFLQRIASAVAQRKCRTFSRCMSNPEVNPFASSDPQGLRYYADCADVPYWLRTYFAWKKNLPMTLTIAVEARDPNDPKITQQNSRVNGNRVSGRADSIADTNQFPDIRTFLGAEGGHGYIADRISSGMFRTPIVPLPDEPLTDFYPIAISRANMRPGTIFYKAGGHVAMVDQIGSDGSIRLLQGHPPDSGQPDTPFTTTFFGEDWPRSRQEHGVAPKYFRPLELVGARADSQGNLIGGRIRLKPNSEIPGASDELGRRSFDSFQQYALYLRSRLSQGQLRLDVPTEFRRTLEAICNKVQARRQLVEGAMEAGTDRQELVATPENIFNSHGEYMYWENLSSPGGDVDLRLLYRAALNTVREGVQGLQNRDPLYAYSGTNIAQDLYNIYRDTARACAVSYTSRGGQRKSIDLEQIRLRLFAISFDPHHCVDLRWGDQESGARNCPEDMRWYNAEQYLRNLTARTPEDSALTLEQMEARNRQRNRPVEWNTNIIGYLQQVAQRVGVTLQ